MVVNFFVGIYMISITNGKYDIPCILSLPKTDDLYPALLMLHGTGTHKNEVGNLYEKLADLLDQKGIASLRIDFSGCGDSKNSDLSYSLSSALNDAQYALNYLKKNQHIDTTRIDVIGFSQGALIAQMLVIEESDLKTLVAWAPAVGDGIKPMENFFNSYYEEAVKNKHAVINYGWRTDSRVNLKWFEELKKQKTLTNIKNYTGNVLAIAGTKDDVLPYDNINKLINASGSENAQAILIKGADHIFNVFDQNKKQSDELLRLTTDWLSINL